MDKNNNEASVENSLDKECIQEEVVNYDGAVGLANDPIAGDQTNNSLKEIESNESLCPMAVELPEGYFWDTVDLSSEREMEEVYKLLKNNYLEDDSAEFAFEYTVEFIKWAVKPPNHKTEWIFGTRVQVSQELIGFISAIPVCASVDNRKIEAAQVNLLCVRKDFRSAGFAPLLSYELQRRIQGEGISLLIYTSEKLIARAPEPIANCSAWFRVLNAKKCFEARYCTIGRGFSLEDSIKSKELPLQDQESKVLNLIKMDCSVDVPEVRRLLCLHLSQFKVHPIYGEQEFEHFFISSFAHVYVIKNSNGQITDLVSFYEQTLNVKNGTQHKTLKCASSMYTVATSVPINELVQNILRVAKKEGYDLYMTLNIMDNMEFIVPLEFEEMDCSLNYYLHGIETEKMKEKDIGIINL